MPELPEVNTLTAALEHQLRHDSIKSWQRFSAKLRQPVPDEKMAAGLIGHEIVTVRRIAKSIYFDFGLQKHLHVHLGMTGGFCLSDSGGERQKHEHLRLELASGRILSFIDPRRFGVVELRELPVDQVIEPFSGQLNWKYLAVACSRSNRSIKALIMDQGIIAGLGNIYAAEALFEAGILPFREAVSLSEKELRKLCDAIVLVIDRAVKSGLKSLQPDFPVSADTTHFEIITHVYGRAGEICEKCANAQIMRVMITGRSSCYCPVCQH